MNYNEMVQRADEFLKNKEYTDAAELYNEVAQNTGDFYCVRRTIDLYILLANADISMAGAGFGMQAMESALANAEISYKWLQVCMEDETVMNEIGEHLEKQYTECLFIAGQVKFAEENSQCVDFLSDAATRGCNPARMYLGMWYDKIVSNELKTESPDIDYLHKVAEKAIIQFESFIRHYNPEEAKSDELETAHLLVSYYYDVGLGTKEDKGRALEHKKNAGHLNK